jgi:hypothetical protein
MASNDINTPVRAPKLFRNPPKVPRTAHLFEKQNGPNYNIKCNSQLTPQTPKDNVSVPLVGSSPSPVPPMKSLSVVTPLDENK